MMATLRDANHWLDRKTGCLYIVHSTYIVSPLQVTIMFGTQQCYVNESSYVLYCVVYPLHAMFA